MLSTLLWNIFFRAQNLLLLQHRFLIFFLFVCYQIKFDQKYICFSFIFYTMTDFFYRSKTFLIGVRFILWEQDFFFDSSQVFFDRGKILFIGARIFFDRNKILLIGVKIFHRSKKFFLNRSNVFFVFDRSMIFFYRNNIFYFERRKLFFFIRAKICLIGVTFSILIKAKYFFFFYFDKCKDLFDSCKIFLIMVRFILIGPKFLFGWSKISFW